MSSTGAAQRTAGSVQLRGVRALEIVASEPTSAAELGRALSIDRSSALRLLGELERNGYVSRNPDSLRFSVTATRLKALLKVESNAKDLREVTDSVISAASDRYGEATVFAVPSAGSMVYASFKPTVHVLAVSEEVGAARPMHSSALGKAYLSTLPSAQLRLEMDRIDYTTGSAQAAKNSEQLQVRLSEIRESGYAIDWEETFVGVRCVAAAILVGGSPVGAIGVQAPAQRLDIDRLHEIGAFLKRSISKAGAGAEGAAHV